jgi:hypothetical protein
MNNTITTTVGIDTVIQTIQTDLYNNLILKWVDDIDGYGRVYKNTNEHNKIVPEWYIGNNEYKDSFYNDQFSCNYMFSDNDKHTTEDGILFNADVKCIFMVDLSRILTTYTSRADVKAQKDVVEILRKSSLVGKIKEIEKGVRNVFRDFDIESLNFTDTHPYHCFSVNIELAYYMEEDCN